MIGQTPTCRCRAGCHWQLACQCFFGRTASHTGGQAARGTRWAISRGRRAGLPRARLALLARVCNAVQYAQNRGVIHRDLKPSNILVDAQGNPKILDFGLARITDADLSVTTVMTETGRIQGTLPYMSPEQARGNPDQIDLRSDVYSLGVILYELLTGRLPYRVSRLMLHEAVRVICEEPPRKPSTISRTLRGDAETIALKALEKDRGRRYQSVAALPPRCTSPSATGLAP